MASTPPWEQPIKTSRCVEAHMVQQRHQVGQVAEVAGDRIALAVAAQVVAEHAVVAGQGWKFVIPLPAVGDTGMEEHDRLALAGDFVVEACAAAAEVTRLSFHGRCPLRADHWARKDTSPSGHGSRGFHVGHMAGVAYRHTFGHWGTSR